GLFVRPIIFCHVAFLFTIVAFFLESFIIAVILWSSPSTRTSFLLMTCYLITILRFVSRMLLQLIFAFVYVECFLFTFWRDSPHMLSYNFLIGKQIFKLTK
ncbi:hypothetical protein PanWU01x14_304980, partial [Parasponia andersonii]